MSPAPAPPPAPPAGDPKPGTPTAAYLGVATLVLLGSALFATAAIAQVRRPANAPPAHVLGVPAWSLAAAGFVSTLAGGLWLRRLV